MSVQGGGMELFVENEEYGPDLVTLVDEEGKEQEFEMVDTMELDGERYVALVAAYDDPEEQLQDDGELVVLKAVTEGDEEFLEAIEDEAEFDKVAAIFMERLEELYDFTDGDEEDGEDEDENGEEAGDEG